MIKPSLDTNEPVQPLTRQMPSTRLFAVGLKISWGDSSMPRFFKPILESSLIGNIPSSHRAQDKGMLVAIRLNTASEQKRETAFMAILKVQRTNLERTDRRLLWAKNGPLPRVCRRSSSHCVHRNQSCCSSRSEPCDCGESEVCNPDRSLDREFPD